MTEAAQEAVEAAPCCAPVAPETVADPKILLFKTPTCPNCKVATMLLEKAGVAFTALNANEEKELVEKYGVKQAPTLVLVKEDGIERYRGVSDIKGWLMHKDA